MWDAALAWLRGVHQTDPIEAFLAAGWRVLTVRTTPAVWGCIVHAASVPPTPLQAHWAPELVRRIRRLDRRYEHQAVCNQVLLWCDAAEQSAVLSSVEACDVRIALWTHVAKVLKTTDQNNRSNPRFKTID
jgi:hypothetical protein